MTGHIPLPATDADLGRLSAANPGWRIERASSGAVSMAPPASGESSRRNHELSMLLGVWAKKHGFVAFDSSAGFKFSDESILSPDAALIPKSIWASLSRDERDSFVTIVPTVVVELVSKTDRPAETREKLAKMRALGVQYALMIDPYRKEIWSDGTPPEDFDIDFSSILD